MAPYYPLTICRSDGLLEFEIRKGVMEPNKPTAAQLDESPNSAGEVDYYKKLEADSPKSIDWTRKIGGMLMATLGGKEQNSKW